MNTDWNGRNRTVLIHEKQGCADFLKTQKSKKLPKLISDLRFQIRSLNTKSIVFPYTSNEQLDI